MWQIAWSIAAAAVILAAADAVPAGADTATAQVRRYTDQVLRVLNDPARGLPERQAAVRALALELFDPEETARRALGRHWQARTAAEREEFMRLFVALLERVYLTRLGRYKGERLTYVGESVNGSLAVVRAKVLLRGQVEVPVEARLLRRGERWYAYDVAVEGISLVGNYRAQFDKIIQTSSYEALVERLRAAGATKTE
jgi:phospholipid transport system substrate-binding protein